MSERDIVLARELVPFCASGSRPGTLRWPTWRSAFHYQASSEFLLVVDLNYDAAICRRETTRNGFQQRHLIPWVGRILNQPEPRKITSLSSITNRAQNSPHSPRYGRLQLQDWMDENSQMSEFGDGTPEPEAGALNSGTQRLSAARAVRE